MTLDPTTLASIVSGHELAGFLPYLRLEVDKMEREIETRAFTALRAGALTPDQALMLWREKLTARELVRRFETRVTVGQSLASDHSEDLDRMAR